MQVLAKEAFFQTEERHYQLLPFRFARIPNLPSQVLLTSETGEFLFFPADHLQELIQGILSSQHPLFEDLIARHFIFEQGTPPPIQRMASQIKTRKSYILGGPAMHIFVVTLRCDHSCQYCQVSRQHVESNCYDMSQDTASEAINRVLESPSDSLTIEFQGGEPLLAFDTIRFIIETLIERNRSFKKTFQFVVTSTLHLLTDEMLAFFRDHHVHLSTSLDGPAWLHNRNRPHPYRNSYQRTLEGITRAREYLGEHSVAALTTLTKLSLQHPEAIIDEYVQQGFHSIFLRPLSPYGFAARTHNHIGYSTDEFLAFYRRSFTHLLKVNQEGYPIDEVNAVLALNSILTPYPHQYVDLRSPTGAGLAALVYNYDGLVYPADEARMLAEMGDTSLALGCVRDPLRKLLLSEPMEKILAAGVAEALPGCSDCAYVPFCGADPIDALARQQDLIGHRPTSHFCAKQTGIFQLIFETLACAEPETMRTLMAWLRQIDRAQIQQPGYMGV